MRNRGFLAGPALALLATLLLATPAQAHKLKVFATSDGETISGYGYFFGGGRVADTPVIVTDANGKTLTELRTDADGNFHFPAKQRQDYRITIDSGDGHMASTTVTAVELPEQVALGDGSEVTLKPKDTETIPLPELSPPIAPPDLATLVEAAVAHQIRPLREQIDTWNDRILWHDILGGLGYIVGMAGLAYGMAGRQRPKSPPGGAGD